MKTRLCPYCNATGGPDAFQPWKCWFCNGTGELTLSQFLRMKILDFYWDEMSIFPLRLRRFLKKRGE